MKTNDFIQKIINKKFSTRARGYDPNEVDEYFDELIEKIRELDDALIKSNEQIDILNNDLINKQKDIENLNNQVTILLQQNEELNKSGYHNEAMFRKIQKLENEIASNKKDNKKEY